MLLWALGVFLLRRPECIFSKCWDPGTCFVCGIGRWRQVVIGLDNNRKSTFFCPRISIKVTAGGWQYGKAYAPLLSSNWPSNEESLIRNPRSIRPSSSALGAPVNLVQSANQPVSVPLSLFSLHIKKKRKKKNSPYIFPPIQPRQVPDIKNHPLYR